MSTDLTQPLMTIEETAKYLKCSKLKVRSLIANGELTIARLGTNERAPIRVYTESIRKLLEPKGVK